MIKVLFIGNPSFDYLSDGILIGLKQIDDIEVYEYYNNSIIYKEPKNLKDEHGYAFTLGNLLDKSIQKIHPKERNLDYYDFFVIGSIFHNYKVVFKSLKWLNRSNTIIFDGMDGASLFPFFGPLVLDWAAWRVFFKRFSYYKRELIENEVFYSKLNGITPKIIKKWLLKYINPKSVSFSIPKMKIIKELSVKTKKFPTHIVDEDILPHINGSKCKYAFKNESDYYEDLQTSKFGITTKRAGWDCMRHYEIAANGAVICFRDLDKKPATCAPLGLVDGVICISYKDYNDLILKIDSISDEQYNDMQRKSIEWVMGHTCTELVKKVIK